MIPDKPRRAAPNIRQMLGDIARLKAQLAEAQHDYLVLKTLRERAEADHDKVTAENEALSRQLAEVQMLLRSYGVDYVITMKTV